jgi:pimeloyl-ACP methyl ester carboxylesterase
MPKIVCVHGIAQEYEAAETLLEVWAPALLGGIGLAGGRLNREEVAIAFYGDLFRPSGKGDGIPSFVPGDIEAGLETELLATWAGVACGDEESGPSKGGAASLVRTLARTPYFGELGQRFVIWYLKQVRRYITDTDLRKRAHDAVLRALVDAEDARVVVGHSLGSVVAYEVLVAHPELAVRSFVTLGSPLGTPALGRQVIPPVVAPVAPWPSAIKHWFNVADRADVVALVRDLRSVFGDRVIDVHVHNGARAHDVRPYLTARETGQVITVGLAG